MCKVVLPKDVFRMYCDAAKTMRRSASARMKTTLGEQPAQAGAGAKFTLAAVRPGQLRDMCAQVGLDVVAIRRIRIGRIPLAKLSVGAWCYLAAGGKF
jgi:16S rRNA U516 pseudouridylate synthase RsuA-like enzyme